MQKLVVFAVAGLAASAAFIGAAAAIGGRDSGNRLDLSFLGDKEDCQTVADATATSRDLDWDGSDRVTIEVPAHTHYSPGNGAKLHITGDPQFLAHLQLRDGKLEMDCHVTHSQREKYHDAMLEVTLPGRPFKAFGLAGIGDMTLEALDQPAVDVSIAGKGSIKASGKVGHTGINIAGSGDADLAQVASQDAVVHIAGRGNVDIAPSDEADIDIAGSGDVNLHTNPKKVETHTIGSGRIHNLATGG